MHVTLAVKKRLPSRPPHYVVYEGRYYSFIKWHRDTLVYRFGDVAGGVMVRIQTHSVNGLRYIRCMVRSDDGRMLQTIDGYRKRRRQTSLHA